MTHAAIRNALLPLLLLSVFAVQGLFLAREMSPTADEVPFHMVNGYTGLKTGDYRMSPANPALLRQWLAIPWLAFQPKLDLNKKSWEEAESVPFAEDVFYRDNRGLTEKLLFSSRCMNLILGAGIGALIFIWSRGLYGFWGGIVSLGFYAFCPAFIAHSSLAHTDVGVSFFCVLSAFFLWKFLQKNTSLYFWAFLIAYGFACAAKQNALVLGPLFLLLLWFRKGTKVFVKSLCGMLCVSFLVIWASYGFEFKPLLWKGVPRQEEKLEYVAQISNALFPGNESARKSFQKAALETPVPIPSYLLGMAGIVRSHRSPYNHYAFGKWGSETHWYYYFFSFLVKMTLPFLFLLLLRLFFSRKIPLPTDAALVLLFPTAVYFLMTMGDSTAVGVRYLFPVIPFLFIWAGGLATLASQIQVWRFILIAAFFLNMISAMAAFPHYLSYFNEAVGGVRGGYRYVRGSDVDWGQGLKSLSRYMAQHGISDITLEHFGSADPAYYGIRYERLSPAEKKEPMPNKVYALGLFFLERAEWTKRVEPDAVVGGSIFLYDFRQKKFASKLA